MYMVSVKVHVEVVAAEVEPIRSLSATELQQSCYSCNIEEGTKSAQRVAAT
jgi:hypothetical protein